MKREKPKLTFLEHINLSRDLSATRNRLVCYTGRMVDTYGRESKEAKLTIQAVGAITGLMNQLGSTIRTEHQREAKQDLDLLYSFRFRENGTISNLVDPIPTVPAPTENEDTKIDQILSAFERDIKL